MDKPAKPKDTFYLFRRERTHGVGYEYIQRLVTQNTLGEVKHFLISRNEILDKHSPILQR